MRRSEPGEPPAAAWSEAVARALPVYGYAGDGAARQRMAAYLAGVAAAQARVRLVGEATPEALARRHLGESLYLGAVLPLGRQRVVDLGAGAGFPGLALALGWPGLNTTLVESNQKKAAFLRAAVKALGLGAQVTVWEGYLERRPRDGERGPLAGADLVAARALEQMERLPGWLGRWLEPGTRVALWTTRAQAESWRRQHPAWAWGEFHPLPGARARGILLAQWPGAVPRETKAA